ncbi:hypothetical protein N9497_03045, partial [Akkermansiaceae bacterium]|nr:hypothetical protein [Akkermansiaceae bacterium]
GGLSWQQEIYDYADWSKEEYAQCPHYPYSAGESLVAKAVEEYPDPKAEQNQDDDLRTSKCPR